jgi:hypothetical protein
MKIAEQVGTGQPATRSESKSEGSEKPLSEAEGPFRVPSLDVVRRAKQGASYQVKVLLFQNLASRNYRVLQLC